ncbi:MAG: hypothetical protein RIT81_32640 [Deltaproteobacteria bacterium]
MNIDLQELLTETWNRFSKSENLVPLLIAALIVLVGGGLTLGILMAPLMVGYIRMCRRVIDGETIEAGQVTEGFSQFARAFVLGLILVVAMIVTACTMVGPLILAFIAMFAFHVIAFDDDIGAIDAIKRSLEIVKANMGPCILVFLIGGVINSVLSGTFVLGIPAFGFVMLMNTILFERLDAATSSAAPQPA